MADEWTSGAGAFGNLLLDVLGLQNKKPEDPNVVPRAPVDRLQDQLLMQILGETLPFERRANTTEFPQSNDPAIRQPSTIAQPAAPGNVGAPPSAPPHPAVASRARVAPKTAPIPAARHIPGGSEPRQLGQEIDGQQPDPGFLQRFSGWLSYLGQPDVQAALLQFSASNFAGQGLGPATIDAFGAAGRSRALREQKALAAADRARAQTKEDKELQLAERRVAAQELTAQSSVDRAQAALLRANKSGKKDTSLKDMVKFYSSNPPEWLGLGELAEVDPLTATELAEAHIQAAADGAFEIAEAVGTLSKDEVLQLYYSGQRDQVVAKLEADARLALLQADTSEAGALPEAGDELAKPKSESSALKRVTGARGRLPQGTKNLLPPGKEFPIHRGKNRD